MGTLYIISVDKGVPGGDYGATVVVRVNDDGTRTLVVCKVTTC